MVEEKNIDNELVYHYCSVEAFLNIVQSKTLWLSDILKSNDSKECSWIKDKINNQIKEHLSKQDTTALKAWKTWYIDTLDMSIYVSCFSERKDFLSQWRGYAQDGQGLAIGFSKKHLLELNDNLPHHLIFDKVIYDEKQQKRFIDETANVHISKMVQKGVGHTALEFDSDYRLKFPLYKNPSFDEEKEWRIIFTSYPYHKKNISCGNFRFLTPKFRVNESKIVSYLELDFSKIKNDIIKEIWIGPKSKVTSQDVMNLLVANDYYDDDFTCDNQQPILIERSASSYQ